VDSKLAVVIGGNGFIGRSLVQRLLADGCRVRIISRQGMSSDPNVEALPGDVSDLESMRRGVAGADVVYSLSTGGGNSWSDFERDLVGGARNVAIACREAGVRRLVYASSIAALYLGSNRVLSDAEPSDPQAHKRSYYARAKALAEQELLKLHREAGLPVVILRPGVVMGPGGPLPHSGLGFWATDVDCIGWGSGSHPLPFVLVDDVGEALRLARTAVGVEGKTLNLAGDVEVSARGFVEELARHSRRLIRFYARPLWQLWLMDVFKWLVKIAARKAENPFPYYRDFASRSLRAKLSCDQTRALLGWKPNASREAFLQQTIAANVPAVPEGDLRRPA